MIINDKNQVAKTILEQLGGAEFIVVTGTKNWHTSGDSLQLYLPKQMSVRVTLDASDTYTLRVFRGTKPPKVATDIYVENLVEVFESMTGLFASFFARNKT